MKKVNNKAYEFCKKSLNLKTTPKYVRLQMKDFLKVCEGSDEKYIVCDEKVKQLENILKILIMPKGLKAGQTLYDCTTGYQWLFYIAILCVVYKNNPKKRRYETGVLEICRKNFKALSLDTPIPTPDGWKTMGEISVGDYVFSRSGKPTEVIGESEIFNKPMYEVEFEDGEIIKASCDHIWTVCTKSSRKTITKKGKRIGQAKSYRKGGWHEKTTEEMARDYFKKRKDGKGTEYKYRVPINGAVEFSEKRLLIDPYLLGLWLGNGFSSGTGISVSNEDKDETAENINEASGFKVEFHGCKNRAGYLKVDKRENNLFDKGSFIYNLKKYDLLKNKHIPLIYMQSSAEQRMALLQGLMDTDGSCSLKGQCSFIQKSEVLSKQVLELINSLGFKARLIKRKAILNGEIKGDVYFISFFASKSKPVFRLKRKIARLKDTLSPRMGAKSIVRITPIEKVPSKCIMVADREHLYLAGKHFTPTHNTYTIATIFILLFLTEPKFSKFYSVAPDGALSKEIREAISETIRMSPLIYEFKNSKRFKILRDYILFKPKQSQYIPLAYSTSRMDGRLPNAFIADEVGALPTSYAIEAMRSGQLNILNKLGFIVSTKYPVIDNPLEDEVKYSKKVLDGIEKDESRFSLLYEPDQVKGWETNDLILKQSNPVSLEIAEIWEDLLKKRAYALAVESARENFVTKHCNIIYQGVGTETYIDTNDVMACKVADIDWEGRIVYLALDLSESDDNTSVSMVSLDEDDNILAESFAFFPSDRLIEKTLKEKVNYRELLETGKVFACGTKVIDYLAVEKFILSIEEKYKVNVQAIGYDRWNALSSAQKLEKAGYNVIEIRQHSSVLHPPTKLLKEKILKGQFKYTENRLLEINFQNARCVYDTNKNTYVNKKKSNGKVDMVVSLINAVYLLEKDNLLDQMDFLAQTI